ncbi:MAG TPA: hypothetical protein VLF66_08560, partial [Thermoanaerobaculia bacterium]|nr:hypothetical protein [Thermoanaerobaculia bacterium]
MDKHITEEMVVRLAEGRVSPKQRARVLTHAFSCNKCRGFLENASLGTGAIRKNFLGADMPRVQYELDEYAR